MKNVIIGTSGHIDHGKTSLIAALTGRSTDKLKEEKERGISIDIGFTYFDLPSGKRAGIIDVPGHEKFIKNMLAGATALDVVLMVIAADEGIMPQTKEHLDILQLLGVKKLIVVLSKKDLVDKEWMDMIKGEVNEYFSNTSFKSPVIIEFSSKTKEGLDDLICEIDKAVDQVEAKDKEGHFRLSVDRIFSVSGFGTVVTGTILSGSVMVGDTIKILPKGIESRVRNIQVHEENVNHGEAGQRCALNLVGVSKEDISRGDVICCDGVINSSYIIDIKFKYLSSNKKNLINRQRVKVYHGTNEILGRVIILDKDEIKPGEESLVQLRLEEEICTQKGDRVVIRNYSPMITLGGGVVLKTNSTKTKRFNYEYIENLKIRESGSIDELIEHSVLKCSDIFPSSKDIIKTVGRNIENIDYILEGLVTDKRIIKITVNNEKIYIHNKFFNKKCDEIYNVLKYFHGNNPLKAGMLREEVKNRVFGNKLKQKVFQEFLVLMENRNLIKQGNTTIALNEFNIILNKEQKRIRDLLINSIKQGGVCPPKVAEIMSNEKNKSVFNEVYLMLVEQGELVKLPEEVVIHKDVLNEAINKIVEFLRDNNSITLAQVKEILNTSRKYLVAIMEYLDNNKVTKRVEDKRVLY